MSSVETAAWTFSARRRASGTAAECCMVRWHDNEATLSRKRHASVLGGVQGNGKGGGATGRRENAADESRNETADGVTR